MFKLNTRERLSLWRQFRQELDLLPIDKAINEANKLWSSCPFTPFFLSLDDIDNWPSPWQLIEENYYCDLAKCLGLVYTLYLTKHKPTLHPEIRIYYDSASKHTYHIAYLCHGKYVLNLIDNDVVNKEHINQQLKLKHRLTADDLRLEQY